LVRGHVAGDNIAVLFRLFVALGSGKFEPHVGKYIVLRDAFAAVVHKAEVELGTCVAVLSGLRVVPRAFRPS
jgi:hypothetical protein